MPINQVDVLLKVIAVLEEMNITYVIGGSFASSAHGNARATMDIDVLAAVRSEHIVPLAEKLQSGFYVNEQAIERAIRIKGHFNVIHVDTSFKVDIFVAKDSGFDAKQLERRQLEIISEDQQFKAYVATAEDIIIAKLDWYRRGNGISDQQWRDIIGVMKIQADKLDKNYLRQWAKELNVDDLLEKALIEAKKFE